MKMTKLAVLTSALSFVVVSGFANEALAAGRPKMTEEEAKIVVTTPKSLGRAPILASEAGLDGDPNDPEFDLQKNYLGPLQAGSGIFGPFYTGHDFVGVWATANDDADIQRVGVVDGDFTKHHDIAWADESLDIIDNDNDAFQTDAAVDELLCDSHGNGVAGVISAFRNNSVGMAGAAVNTEIVAARALNCGVGGLEFADAVRWLAGDSLDGVEDISEPVDVINLSLGVAFEGGCTVYTQAAIDYAVERNIPVVVAAGNESADTKDFLPAGCEGVTVIASTDWIGDKADFSNYGDNVVIAALGKDIVSYSTRESDTDNLVSLWEGTSFTAPLVTAAIATAKGQAPDLAVGDINYLLVATADAFVDDSTCNTSDAKCGVGTLNANAFVEAAKVLRTGGVGYIRHAFSDDDSCVTSVLTAQLGGVNSCDLYEVAMNAEANEKDFITYVMYRVSKGGELVVGGADVETFIEETSETTRIMEMTVNDLNDYDYGVSACINGTCSSITPIDVNPEKGAQCQ